MQDKQRNAREAYRASLSSPSEVITMLNKTEKKQNENMEQDKTQHETPRRLHQRTCLAVHVF